MPTGIPPVRAHPSKPFRTLADAAKAGQLVMVRCNRCRQCMHYLASDLAEVVGADHPVHIPPFKCSRCGDGEFVDVRCRLPAPGEIGELPIRRPIGWRRIWKTERL